MTVVRIEGYVSLVDTWNTHVNVLSLHLLESMKSSSTPSIPTLDSSTINPQSICQKTDLAWTHVTMTQSSDRKKLLICNFCEKVIKGGGISRIKMHLAGQSGVVARCKKVLSDVCF